MTSPTTLLVLGIGLFGACSGENEQAPLATAPLPEPETRRFRACGVDGDCTFVNNGCCDCANGGEEIAINRDMVGAFRAQFDCAHASCTMVGRSPPCGCGIASCVGGLCEYAVDGPGCDDVTVSCGANLGLSDADLVEVDATGVERRWSIDVP